MTRKQAAQLLPVIQAFAEGQTIQYKFTGEWKDIHTPAFEARAEYRIKPEPREFAIYLSKMDKLITEDTPSTAHLKGYGWEQIRVREILEP